MVIILLLSSFSNVVSAADFSQQSNYVDLQPGYQGNNTIVNNLADESTIHKEEDFIRSDFGQSSYGKYYGPYGQSSLYRFSTVGGYFQTTMNFTVTSSIIMNGVSDMVLRIPVLPSQYQWWHVYLNWDPDADFAECSPTGYGISAGGENYKLVMPFAIPGIAYYDSLFPGVNIGNYWSIEQGSDNMIKETDQGLYLVLKGSFLPNIAFTVSFTGLLKEGQSPTVFVTSETAGAYTYSVFDFTRVGSSSKFKYYNNINFPVSPSFAFIFLNGIGDLGMTSFQFDFMGDQKLQIYGINQTFWFYPTSSLTTTELMKKHNGYSNSTYFSFYMPFETIRNYDSHEDVTIDWQVTVHLSKVIDLWDFDVGGTLVKDITFTISDTSNYLLFTTPNKIERKAIMYGFLDTQCYIWIELKPIQNCTLKFLGYADTSVTDIFDKVSFVSNQTWKGGAVNINQMFNIHHSCDFTVGLWAQISETTYYTIYDFKWGKGYAINGDANIYIFLDGGAQYLYTGSLEDLVKRLNAQYSDMGLDPLSNIIKAIYKAATTVTGWIHDGISWIINTLIQVGEFIYNVVDGIIKWIVSVATDIAGKVADIVKGMIFGLPIIGTLFIVNYVGQALQTGQLPKLTKERRLFKKLKREIKSQVRPRVKKIKKINSDREALLVQRDRWNRDTPENRRRLARQESSDASRRRKAIRQYESRERKDVRGSIARYHKRIRDEERAAKKK